MSQGAEFNASHSIVQTVASGLLTITLTNTDNFETLIGSAHNDVLASYVNPVRIEGLAGSDYLEGSFNNDTLIGGDGDDWLRGYDGDDWFEGVPATTFWRVKTTPTRTASVAAQTWAPTRFGTMTSPTILSISRNSAKRSIGTRRARLTR